MNPTNSLISRRVWILSLVSLFTDMASEMLYPVMPIYLKSIGFSIVLIGVLEGLAEAVAGLSKSYFGRLSDQSHRRAPFVRLGYTLSALSKPMTAFFRAPIWVFGIRTLDRLGKGIRTGARDALLSEEATPATKGRVFGLHRAMDTVGAVFGPLLALSFLHFNPGQYSTLFYFAFLPGIMAVGLTLTLRDKQVQLNEKGKLRPSFRESLAYWKKSPLIYRQLLKGLLFFALFNSSDVFLLLKVREAGFSDTTVVGMYIFYNLTYAASAYPAGVMGDRMGLKKVLLTGLGMFALVYAGMAASTQIWQFLALFFAYGLYAGLTEGTAKAWISNMVAPGDTATAMGMYAGFQSICALFASSLAGLIWYEWSASAALLLSSFSAVCALFWVLRVPREPAPEMS